VKNKIIKFLVCGVLVFTLVGCSGGHVEQEVVPAVIVSMEYVPSRSWVTMMPTGKTMIPVTHHSSEEFNVVVAHEGLTLKIDSKAVYDSLEIGESIQVLLVKKFDAEGQLKKSKLMQI